MPEAATIPVPVDLIEAYRSRIEGRAVLLYDGVCVFCNHTVERFIQMDRQAILLYVPLESPLGEQLLDRLHAQHGVEGIILITNALTSAAKLSRRTDAFSDALALFGGIWRTLGQFIRLIPRPIREFGYGIVARYRYHIFGRYESCPLPTPEQRARILGIPT